MGQEPQTVTYEITAIVRADLCDAYEAYMRDNHIPQLLETGAFAGATLSRSSPGRYRTRYEAHSREALDHYLIKHAPRLREHFAKTFPTGIDLAREEWDILETW
jgi:hypothetical protein